MMNARCGSRTRLRCPPILPGATEPVARKRCVHFTTDDTATPNRAATPADLPPPQLRQPHALECLRKEVSPSDAGLRPRQHLESHPPSKGNPSRFNQHMKRSSRLRKKVLRRCQSEVDGARRIQSSTDLDSNVAHHQHLSEFFRSLLSCSPSRAQTRSFVSGFRRTQKKQSDAHGRRQRLKTPVNKLSCAGWLPHDRDSVSGCLVLGTSVGTWPAHNRSRGFPAVALPPAVGA
jgi:hypothetical protein